MKDMEMLLFTCVPGRVLSVVLFSNQGVVRRIHSNSFKNKVSEISVWLVIYNVYSP